MRREGGRKDGAAERQRWLHARTVDAPLAGSESTRPIPSFVQEIQKVVDFYMKMPDPDADGSAFSGLDMSMFEGLAKSPDEDASDDLDNLGDEDEDEGDGEGEL